MTPTTFAPSNGGGVVEVARRSRSGSRGVPTISHSRVSSLVFAEWRPPTTTIRSTSRAVSSVSSWRRIVTGQTVLTILSSWLATDHERGQLLELPGRLRGLGDQRHPLAARDAVPVLLLVDDDRVGREAEQADDLGVLRRAEQDDRCSPPSTSSSSSRCSWMTQVQVPSMTSRPRASARSMTSGLTPWARMTTAAPWSTSSSDSTVSTPSCCRSRDDALVVDDLAQGVRRLAGRRRLLRLVDRLAHAIAEAGALGDPDVLDGSHGSMVAQAAQSRRGFGYLEGSGFRLPGSGRDASSGTASAYTPRWRGSRRAAMRPMIAVVAMALAARRSVPAGTTSATRNGSPTRTVTVRRGIGSGILLPRGQTRSLSLIPIGTIGGPGPQRQHREAVLRLLQLAVGAARALREDQQDVAAHRGSGSRGGTPRCRRCRDPPGGRRRELPASRTRASRTAPSCPASGSADCAGPA